MIEHRPYHTLGGSDAGWLKARLHVDIGGMGKPEHLPLGALRAWNDDEFAARSGFPMHGHQDVVILTYVRSGAVTHEDSLGNTHTVQAGDVQAMHAGSGIRHAEFNAGDEPVRLFQIWLQPRSRGGAPAWDTRHFPRDARSAGLAALASGYPGDSDAMRIDTDARLLACTLRKGQTVTHALAGGRSAYLVTTTGGALVNGLALEARDGAALRDEPELRITALGDTEIVIVETHQ